MVLLVIVKYAEFVLSLFLYVFAVGCFEFGCQLLHPSIVVIFLPLVRKQCCELESS